MTDEVPDMITRCYRHQMPEHYGRELVTEPDLSQAGVHAEQPDSAPWTVPDLVEEDTRFAGLVDTA